MSAVLVFSFFILLSMFLAYRSNQGAISNNLNDVMVAGRNFGGFLLFFLAVGEIYGIGTMIGVPGAVYTKGSSYILWFLGYILLAYPVGYFINPLIWRIGKISNSITMADTFRWRFNSRGLEIIIALIGILAILPWIQMQFLGLGVITEYLGIGVRFEAGVIGSAFIAMFYILISGIKASAWVAILKDVLMIASILIGGVTAAAHSPGGVQGIFELAQARFPAHLVVPTEPTLQVATFALTTILFQAVGMCASPFAVQFILSGRSENIVRRNYVYMPIYMLMYPFLVTAAFFALVTLNQLKRPDEAFMAVAVHYLPGWIVGVIAAGGALTCILVIAVVTLSISGLVSKNIIGSLKPGISSKGILVWSRIVTVSVLILTVLMTLFFANFMLGLIVISYYGMTQLFIPIAAMLFWRRATKWGVGAGALSGTAAVMAMHFAGVNISGINIGLISLVFNALVMCIVSLATARDLKAEERFENFATYYSRKKAPAARSTADA